MTTGTRVPHRALTLTLTIAIPAVAGVATAALAALWGGELPDPAAVRWRPDGPVGFGSAAALVGVMLAGIVVVAVAGVIVVTSRAGRSSGTRRIAAGVAAGFGVFLAGVCVGLLAIQRGLADAADAPDPDTALLVAALAAITIGALVAWAVPGDPRRPADAPVPSDAPALPLGSDERAAWVHAVGSTVGLVAGTAAVAVLAVLFAATRTPVVLVVLALVLALLVTVTQFVVTVDGRGLTVRSKAGWPRIVVPLDEVVRADATTVEPMREFGGMGYRFGANGRVGFVLRGGEAIEVQRSGSRTFVVSVEDAATGAALLNSLAARQRASKG